MLLRLHHHKQSLDWCAVFVLRLAKVSTKHELLKEIKGISRVTKEQFIICVSDCPKLLRAFTRQAINFRKLVTPYKQGGSEPFASIDGVHTENYGTRGRRNLGPDCGRRIECGGVCTLY